MRQHQQMAFAAVCLLGTALRLIQLGTQSLWLDEAFSVLLAQRNWDLIIVGTAQDPSPPLYYFVLSTFLAFDNSEFTARLPSALFGILSIPVLYALARELFDESTALMSALLLALNPFHIFYSQEARMYSQLAFLGLGSAFCFIRAWHTGKVWLWTGFVAATTAALYTHNTAFLLVMALGTLVVLRWNESRHRLWPLAVSFGAVFLLFSPWLLYLPQQMTHVKGTYFVEAPSLLQGFAILPLFLFGHALPRGWAVAALTLATYAAVLACYLALQALRRKEPGSESLVFVLCLFLVPLGVALLVSQLVPIFIGRTLIISALALTILLAWALLRSPRLVTIALTLTWLAVTGVSLHNSYANPAYQKPPMRDAATYVAGSVQPDDIVIHTSDSSYLAFAYYVPDLSRHFLSGDPDYESDTVRGRAGRIAGIKPESLRDIVPSKSRLWLIVTLDHNIEYQQKLTNDFDQCYAALNRIEIGGIQIRLYDLTTVDNTCPRIGLAGQMSSVVIRKANA